MTLYINLYANRSTNNFIAIVTLWKTLLRFLKPVSDKQSEKEKESWKRHTNRKKKVGEVY